MRFVVMMLWLMLAGVLPALEPVRETRETSGRVIVWYDAATMRMEGRGWDEPGRAFHRLPARAEGRVTAEVWRLEANTAGLAVRFATDSASIHARWSGGRAMQHMPATGVSGVDLYARGESGWKFVAGGRPKDGETTRTLTSGRTGMGDYRLYLPLYQKVDYLEIGVEKGSRFSQPEPANELPIIFYGTSIVQGGCASRPGMAHTAILGRWLDREAINLGFSGSARMEPAMAELVGELDAAVYVLDCLPNMTDDLVPGRVEAFVRQLRARRPDTPIVMVGHLKDDQVAARNERFRALVAQLQAEGDSRLFHLEGRDLLRPIEEGTVDGIHPTDLGFFWMAEAHLPVLKKALGEE